MRKLTDIVPLQVRIPEGLRRKLAKEAEENGRSLNSEIVWRLGQSSDASVLAQEQMAQMTKRVEEIMALVTLLGGEKGKR